MKPKIKLLDNEEILLELQPNHRLALYIVLKKMSLFFVAGVFLVIYANIQKKDINLSVFFQTVALLFIIFFLCFFWLRFMVSRHWYFITNQRVILYYGFLGMNMRSIPYNRIIDVNFSQNLYEKLLKIASVNLAEQSSNFSQTNPSLISGLSLDQAEELAHIINEKITKKVI